MPAFAVGRTQQILFHLDELFSEGVMKPFPVYLDSPMAIEATRIYRSHPDLLDDETRDLESASEIARHHRYVKPTPRGAAPSGLERWSDAISINMSRLRRCDSRQMSVQNV